MDNASGFEVELRKLFDKLESDDQFFDAFESVSNMLGFVFSNTEDPYSYFGTFISETSSALEFYLEQKDTMLEASRSDKH